MNDTPATEAKRKARLRWVTLGEAIALAALIISGIGVWLSWKGSSEEKSPTTIVEQRQAIPLALRGRARSDGRALEIMPVEDSHALQSLTVAPQGAKPIEFGSDGELERPRPAKMRSAKAPPDGKGTHRAPRPHRRQICRSRRRQVGHRLLRDQLSLGRRRPVRRPLRCRLVGLSRLADDFFRLEEEVDLDLRILVAVRAVDRIGLDRFGDKSCGSCLRRHWPGWSRP